MISQQQKIKHLYWRAGFGITPAELQKLSAMPFKNVVKNIFEASRQFSPIQEIEEEEADAHTALKKAKRQLKKNEEVPESKKDKREMLKELIQEQRDQFGDLNTTWMNMMSSNEGVLREKMTLFWHNHFACRSKLPTLMQRQNNTLRKHSLSNFGDLLMAISKDAAMLQFLNNQQNSKRSPNENFAREVMELFTLGRGNYTEQDIKEAARAFTGWGFDKSGGFVFRENLHDDGMKTVFGNKGNFKGEDILKMLLENPQTATHICSKVYKHFVNERIDNKLVGKMAERFFKTNYDIADLMQYIFESDWFYEKHNLGGKIKSPIELLVGIRRTLGAGFTEKRSVLGVQKILGQVLFYPPNVAGWSGGQSWIDSSSLLARMSLPKVIFQNKALQVAAKDNGDANEAQYKHKGGFGATMDWGVYAQHFADINDTQLAQTLANHLLQVAVNERTIEAIDKKIEKSDRTTYIKNMTLALMALPEYQVC